MTSYPLSLFADTLFLAVAEKGSGRPHLLLHGGAGPRSMAGLAEALAQTGRAVVPTHPGFNGQPRPSWFHRIDDLVLAYLALLERLDLQEVVVIGSSMGGWLAAELGLRASPRVAAIVLLNAVGLNSTPDSGDIVDPSSLAPAERTAYAYHDPARFAPVLNSPDAAAAMAANQQSLRTYAGQPFMHDPSLRTRLTSLPLPTLILWGESDRIVPLTYGQQFAAVIPNAHFQLVPQAGHFPQIEQLAEVVTRIQNFTTNQVPAT